ISTTLDDTVSMPRVGARKKRSNRRIETIGLLGSSRYVPAPCKDNLTRVLSPKRPSASACSRRKHPAVGLSLVGYQEGIKNTCTVQPHLSRVRTVRTMLH